jgi:hypothetical protein
MAIRPTPLLPFDASVVGQLACPACHGDLRFENSSLICNACRRAYPIVDGIPVLIADRAERTTPSIKERI